MLLLQLREEARQGHPEGLRHLPGRDDSDRDLPPLELPVVAMVVPSSGSAGEALFSPSRWYVARHMAQTMLKNGFGPRGAALVATRLGGRTAGS